MSSVGIELRTLGAYFVVVADIYIHYITHILSTHSRGIGKSTFVLAI